ncbi:MAG: diphthine synthase [bacterium]|nr:diphthine synthase [bacterium]
MLYIIGAGLGSPAFLTRKAEECLRASDVVFVDGYTGLLSLELLDHVRQLCPQVVVLRREQCELEDYQPVLGAAKHGTVSFLVPGDPFTATTHHCLILRCAELGIKYEIVPGVSIVTAALGIAGLQIYKLGLVATFPLDYSRIYSLKERVLKALQQGRHVLLLTELNIESGKCPQPEDMARYFSELRDRWVVVLSRLGFPEQQIAACKIEELRKIKARPPWCAVLPGDLHPVEEECLKLLAKNKF